MAMEDARDPFKGKRGYGHKAWRYRANCPKCKETTHRCRCGKAPCKFCNGLGILKFGGKCPCGANPAPPKSSGK